jgi:hypothetical protein
MSPRTVILNGVPAAIISLIISGGCSKSFPSYAPTVAPAEAGKAALEQYDANKDGKIAGPELDKVPALKSDLANLDANQDQAVSAEEIAERVRFWQTKDKLARQVRCYVTHNGEPLADAEVKLVPEKFLGEMRIAEGKAQGNGMTIPGDGTTPDSSPVMGPGFYRVEITKPGENIPAKYNQETTLGIDNTAYSEVLIHGAHFDLQY